MFSRINKNNDIIKYFPWIICLIFIALNLVIYIKFPFLSIDEGYTKGIVNLPFFDMINATIDDVHPPLYYIIVMLFLKLAHIFHIPFSDYLMKLPSIIIYLIIIIISLTKIRKDYGLFNAGFFSLSLLIMSNFFTYFLTARMYSLAILFLLISFLLVKNIYESNDLKSWILLSIFSVLGAYTHYFAAISSVVLYFLLFLWTIFYKDEHFDFKGKFKNFIISVIVGIVLYIPWISPLFSQLHTVHDSFWVEQITLETLIKFFSYYLTILPDFSIQIVSCIILFAITLKVAIDFKRSKNTHDLYLLSGFLIFIGTITIGSILSLAMKPILYDRYLLPAIGVLWLAFSIALNKIKSNRIILSILLILIIIGSVNVLNEIDIIHNEYDNTVKEDAFLESINNDNSIILYDTDNHFIRTHYYLDNVFEKYASYSLNNHTNTLNYNKFHANYDTFVIPNNINDFSDKDIYLLVFYKNDVETGNFTSDFAGEAQHAKFYKLNCL